MAQNSLVKYIREQIRAGYSADAIKKYLLKYGYPKSRINEAFQSAYPPSEVKHIMHPSKMMVILIVAVICSLFLVSAGIYMFFIFRAPSQLLDVQVDLVSSSVEDELRFTSEIFNLGRSKRYDVSLRYEIYDLRDEIVKFKEETVALETRASSSVVIDLSGVNPGNYYLRATAFYGDKTARATSSFRVIKGKEPEPVEPEPVEPEPVEPEPVEPVKRCPSSCDDSDECTNDYCDRGTNYECRYDIVYSCCGNGICEDNEDYRNCLADCEVPKEKEDSIFGDKPVWERVDLIKEVGKSDKEKALEYCKEIEQTGYRYNCFSGVAVSSGDWELCLNIEDGSYKDSCYKEYATTKRDSDTCSRIVKDSKRDQCYMDFANKGDYTICDKLVNKYLKQGCDSLKKLSEVKVPDV